MDKIQYYEISKKSSLPLRCPILNKCERRLVTLNILDQSNDPVTRQVGYVELTEDLQVNLEGDYPGFTNLCPEVHLFSSSISLTFARELAVKSCSFNIEKDKFDEAEFTHYSECPEFCSYQFSAENGILNNNELLLNETIKNLAPVIFECYHKDLSIEEISDKILELSLLILKKLGQQF